MKWYYSDRSGGSILTDGDGRDMGKDDRLAQVLDLLAESEFALGPSAIYRNLQLVDDRVTFQERSMKNYMPELADMGLVMPVDPKALSDGRVEQGEIGNCYYMITDKGREWLRSYHQ